MSFQNLPAQLTALLLGWMFTLYLQYVANRRAESLKRKEKIIDKLDALVGWVESEISKKDFSPEDTEEAFSGILLHLELRINQFNSHAGCDLIDSTRLASFRDVNFFDDPGLTRLPYLVGAYSSRLIEDIELACNQKFFSDSIFRRALNFLYELYGLVVGLVAIILFLILGYLVNRLVLG